MMARRTHADIGFLLRRSKILAIGFLVFGASLVGATYLERDAAQADIERLSLIWPFVARLQDTDRAFLAGLALTCKLHQHSDTRDEVVACLRSAAADPAAILPRDMNSADASSRLESMLAFAPDPNSLK